LQPAADSSSQRQTADSTAMNSNRFTFPLIERRYFLTFEAVVKPAASAASSYEQQPAAMSSRQQQQQAPDSSSEQQPAASVRDDA
jgi:hypothetical protein